MKMKKILLTLSVLFTIGFSSCTGPQGPMGPQGPAGYDGKDGEQTYWVIQDFDVDHVDWKYSEVDGLRPHYYYDFEFDNLTDFIYNNGIVLAYLEVKGRQQLLPFVFHEEILNEDNEYVRWTRTIDFDYTSGNITFYVTTDDFFYEDYEPETMRFRVVLLY